MAEQPIHHGRCFCGAVRFTVAGDPEAMGYCHCESCRHWSAGPVNAFSLWKPDAVTVTQGNDRIAHYNKTPASTRQWCRDCGGHLFTDHPELGLIDIYPAVLAGLNFEPAIHVHYQEAMLQIRDGLPKMRDVPEAMGGSGETLRE
jgi:hypothetical protein